MSKQVNTLDKFFKECFKLEKKRFDERVKEYQEAKINTEILIEDINEELQLIEKEIYTLIDYEGCEHPREPFMAKILKYLDELIKYKKENMFTQLFTKRKIFEEEAKRIRFYGSSEFINQSDEQIIEFIAKYKYKLFLSQLFKGKATFIEWQINNHLDLQNIITIIKYPDYLEVERVLYAKSMLNPLGQWIGEKVELVAFILTLIETKFLKTFIFGKPLPFTTYRDFFNNRYKIDISQESQPSRRKKIASIKRYFSNFDFIK